MTALGEAELLGVRALRYVDAHRGELLGLALVFAFLGAAAGFALERPHTAKAVIQIGLRSPNDPIEDRLVTAKRLEGFALTLTAPSGLGEVEAQATPVGAGSAGRPDRLVELVVRAKSASVASSVVRGSVERLLAVHEELHRYDLEVNEEQVARINAEADAIEAQLENDPHADEGELAQVLYMARREANGFAGWLVPSRAPPSRLISADPNPRQPPSRVPIFAAAGAGFGLVLGVFLTLVRSLVPEAPRPRSAGSVQALEALTLGLVRFISRYKKLLLAVSAAGAVLGAGTAALRPQRYQGRAVVRSALVFPDGPVEPMEPAAMRLRNQLDIERRKIGGQSPDADVSVRVINHFESPIVPSNMFEVISMSSSPDAARRGVEQAIRLLASNQDPLVHSELERLERQSKAYDKQLAKRPTAGRTAHEARGFVELVRELANSRRTTAPSRVHVSEVLVGPTVLPTKNTQRVAAFAMLGLFAGLLLGAALGYVLTSLRPAGAD